MSIGRFVAPALILATLAPATALAACPAGPVLVGGAIKPGAEVFGIEGPMTAFESPLADGGDGTVTVAGTCVNIPGTVKIDTDADGVGDISLYELVRAVAGRRDARGGTMIIDGDATVDATGHIVFTATLPYFEFGEHVFVGPLASVDTARGTFYAGHTLVKMNTDSRLPSDLLDLGGKPTTVANMLGFEGTVVSAQGYMSDSVDAVTGLPFMWGTFVETEVVPTVVGKDTVVIERAQYRTSKRSIDVRGQVSAQEGTGLYTPTVTIDVNCDSTIENTATATVDPVTGLADYRWLSPNNAFATTPSVVCVASSLYGGAATRATEVRN